MGSTWPESTPTAAGSYTAPTQAADAQTYEHEQRRNIRFSGNALSPLRDGWTSDSTGRTTSEYRFEYDWDSVFPGYQPEDAKWEDPRPMEDSPLNPR